MSAADIRAGRAFVELDTKSEGLMRGLKTASQRVSDWVKHQRGALSGLGNMIGTAFAAQKLGGLAKNFAESGAKMADLQQQTGLTTKELAGLKKAGEEHDVPFEAMSRGLTTLQKNVAKGSGEVDAALRELGTSAAALSGMPLSRVLSTIADLLPRVADESERVRIVTTLFGEAGARLLPVLMQGSDGLRAQADAAEKLGMVMSDSTMAAAAQLDDGLDKLQQSVGVLTNRLGEALAPALIAIVEAASSALTTISAWIAENPKLAETLGIVATSLGGLHLAVTGISAVMTTATTVAGGLAAAYRALAIAARAAWIAASGPIGWAAAAGAAVGIGIASLLEPSDDERAQAIAQGGLKGGLVQGAGRISESLARTPVSQPAAAPSAPAAIAEIDEKAAEKVRKAEEKARAAEEKARRQEEEQAQREIEREQKREDDFLRDLIADAERAWRTLGNDVVEARDNYEEAVSRPSSTEVLGVFNASAAGQMGFGSQADRTKIEALRELGRDVRRAVRAMEATQRELEARGRFE